MKPLRIRKKKKNVGAIDFSHLSVTWENYSILLTALVGTSAAPFNQLQSLTLAQTFYELLNLII